jgi:hypothetical protein
MREIWNDDDALLAALREAIQAADDVPPSFIEAGKAAYTWHNIDAELAELTYDSAHDDARTPVATRAEPAPLRALTFVSPGLTIELEVNDEALLGQLVPPQEGEVQIHTADGPTVRASVDEIGCFVIRPAPAEAFRLYCRTADGTSVLTGFVTL